MKDVLNIESEAQEDEQKPEVIRVEANLEELPVFSATKRSRKEEIVTWRRKGRNPKTGQPIEQEMIIRPARGLGLPGQVERDLYYLVIGPWIEARGFGPGGLIGPITYTEAIKRLGWQRSGQNYDKIREALKTLVSLNFEFNNCIVVSDGEKREIRQYFYGHLFEKVSGLEERAAGSDRVSRGEFVIMAADWFVANHKNSYVKPIDLTVYRSLTSPIAQSLYTYLDKRAYSARLKTYEHEMVEDILVLRDRFRLGVRVMRDLLKQFRRAHEDLVKNWPSLQGAWIKKLSPGKYQCIYTFDSQYELPLEPKQPQKEPEVGELSPLVGELVDRGITQSIAQKLASDYPEEQIRRQIDIHDQEQKQGTPMQNPGGRLRKRVQEDWKPFKGYQEPTEREKTSQRANQRLRNESEEEDRRVNWWKYITPEEKARDYVRGPGLVKWQAGHGFHGQPTEEEKQEIYEAALIRFQAEAEEGKQKS